MKTFTLCAVQAYVEGINYIRLATIYGDHSWYVFDPNGWTVVSEQKHTELEQALAKTKQ